MALPTQDDNLAGYANASVSRMEGFANADFALAHGCDSLSLSRLMRSPPRTDTAGVTAARATTTSTCRTQPTSSTASRSRISGASSGSSRWGRCRLARRPLTIRSLLLATPRCPQTLPLPNIHRQRPLDADARSLLGAVRLARRLRASFLSLPSSPPCALLTDEPAPVRTRSSSSGLAKAAAPSRGGSSRSRTCRLTRRSRVSGSARGSEEGVLSISMYAGRGLAVGGRPLVRLAFTHSASPSCVRPWRANSAT